MLSPPAEVNPTSSNFQAPCPRNPMIGDVRGNNTAQIIAIVYH